MNKRRPADSDKNIYPFSLADHQQRWADNSNRLKSLVQPDKTGHGRTKTESDATAIIIFGLLSLQLLALVAALLILTPLIQSNKTQNIADAPALLPTLTPTSLVSPPPPTPIPAFLPPAPQPVAPSPEAVVEPTTLPPPPEPAALRLRVEITQGIQVFNEPENLKCQPNPAYPNYIFCNNSIPLVAGRYTLVRVYPACNGECPGSEVMLNLHLVKDGQEQTTLSQRLAPDKLAQLNSLPLSDLRASLDYSVNFEFFPPPAWMTGQISFNFEAIPVGGPNQAPATLTLTKEFAVRKPLRIAYLPIQIQGHRPPEPADIDYWLQRLYPVSDVEYYRLPMPDLVWDGDLTKSEILRRLFYTYWLYAENHPEEEWPDQLFGWLPQEFYNGGVSDPFWCPNCAGPHSSRVAFGGWRPEQDIGAPRILVHEIAHNLGAQHAWSPTKQQDGDCFRAEGADIRVDPEWPYLQTPHIQEFGIDLYSNPPVIYPPSFYDMMAYCTHPWISPHTYRKLFDSPFLQPNGAAGLPLANFKPEAEVTAGGTLLVSGVIYPNGNVSQPEIIRLEGTAFDNGSAFSPNIQFTPPPGDDYCVKLQASDNRTLAQQCFEAGFTDLETGLPTESSSYFFTLSNVNIDEVAHISVSKHDVQLISTTPSQTPPQVTVTYPNGGERLSGQASITWNASDADGDTLLYDILYSPDGGQSWLPLAIRLSQTSYTFQTGQLPASTNALIRVIATDDFHTSQDESNAPFVLAAPMQNSLNIQGPAAVQPGQTFEVTVVAHQIAEPGLFGIQFKLDFDPARLRVETVQLHPSLSLVADKTIRNDIGQLSIAASRQGQVPNLTDDITLATITFTAASPGGDAHLYLSDVIAGARDGQRVTLSDIQDYYPRIAP